MTPSTTGIQDRRISNPQPVGQRRDPLSITDQDIDCIIESLAWTTACPQNLKPQDLKKFIHDNLQGNNGFLAQPSIPQSPVEYFALKIYAAMLKNLGHGIRIPENDAALTGKELTNFVEDLRKAAFQFAKNGKLAAASQKELFVSYQSFVDKSRADWIKEVAIVSSVNPVPVARISVGGGTGLPQEYVYQENGRSHVLSLVENGRDPLYAAIQQGKELSPDQPITAGSLKGLMIEGFTGLVQETFTAFNKLKDVLSDQGKRRSLEAAVSIDRKLQEQITAERGIFKANPYLRQLSPEMRAQIDRLYQSVAGFYGQAQLDALLDGRSQELGGQAGEDLRSALKLEIAEAALKEYSLAALQKNLEDLSQMAKVQTPPELTFESFSSADSWLNNVKGAILYQTQAERLPQTAREYFILRNTRSLPPEAKNSFLRNLELLESGDLVYQSIQGRQLGIARPFNFRSSQYGLRADLINFNLGADDPVVSVLAGSMRPRFAEDTSRIGNKEIILAYLEYIGKESGQKISEARFSDLYQPSLNRTNGTLPAQAEFYPLARMAAAEKAGNLQVIGRAADIAGIKQEPEQAMNMLQPVLKERKTWVLIRRKGSSDIIAVSLAAEGSWTSLPDPGKTAGLMGGLLKVADPLSSGKDFDFFSASAGFRSRKSLTDPETMAMEVARNWQQKSAGPMNGETMARAADLLKAFLSKPHSSIKTREVVKAELIKCLPGSGKGGEIIEASLSLLEEMLSYQYSPVKDLETLCQSKELISYFNTVVDQLKASSQNKAFGDLLKDYSSDNYEVVFINQKFLSALLDEGRNRIALQGGGNSSSVSITDTLVISQDTSMFELVRDHPILSIKLYLHVYSNAPNPVIKAGSQFQAVEDITANDINAYINLAYFNTFDPGKKSLNDEDFRTLLRVRDYLAEGRVKISGLDHKLFGRDEVTKDVNRTLELLRNLRDSLERLADSQGLQDPLYQRLVSQAEAGEPATPIANLAKNAVKSLFTLPSFAAVTKNQNIVIDANVLALKEEFQGKSGLGDTSIDGDFVEKFCDNFGPLLENPLLNEITGNRQELSYTNNNPEAFLRMTARRMKENKERWGSLNLNAADYKDADVVEAKRMLQAALLLYQPGQKPLPAGAAGKVMKNLDAAANYAKMVVMGQNVMMNFALTLKSALLQHGLIKGDAADFSLLNDKVSQEVVNTAGTAFLAFLDELKTEEDKKRLIEGLENDPINGMTLEGKNATEKFVCLKNYALALRDARLEKPVSFSYTSYQSGNDMIENGLLIFTCSILPQFTDQQSAGGEKTINFGSTLYRLMGGNGKIEVLGAKGQNQIISEPLPAAPKTHPVSAFENQILYNYLNFKVLMMPTIQLQMQAGIIYQLSAIQHAAIHGNPYASQHRFNAVQNWLNTRAQFVAFRFNPLAWASPSEVRELIKNGDIAGALTYGLFFGPMALQMVKGLKQELPQTFNRLLSTYDKIRGRKPFVSQVYIRDMLLEDPKFLENELEILEQVNPGIKGWYKACRAAGKVVEAPFLIKDAIFNPLDTVSQLKYTRFAQYLSKKTHEHMGQYLRMLNNRIGARLVSNPVSNGERALFLAERGDFLTLFKDPSAQWHFEIATPIKSVHFDLADLEALQKGTDLREILTNKGYVILEGERYKYGWANKADSLLRKAVKLGKAITPEQLRIINEQISPYMYADLKTLENPAQDIPIKFRTTAKSLSALDVFRLAAEPANSEHVFEALGLSLTTSQKAALLGEIRSNFTVFMGIFGEEFVRNLPEDVIREQGGKAAIIQRLIEEGPEAVEKIYTDEVLTRVAEQQGETGRISESGGEAEVFSDTRAHWKKLASIFQACKDPQKAQALLKKWEDLFRNQKAQMEQNLKYAAKNPSSAQPVTIMDSTLPGGKLILEIENIDLLRSIKSMCDPSNLKSFSVFASLDPELYSRSLESVFSTGKNQKQLTAIFNALKNQDPEYTKMLDKMLEAQPKALKEHFLKFEEGEQRYARLLLSIILQESVIGRYAELFKNGFIGNFFLKNEVQFTIGKYARRGEINIGVTAAAQRAHNVAGKASPAAGLEPELTPAYAREKGGSSATRENVRLLTVSENNSRALAATDNEGLPTPKKPNQIPTERGPNFGGSLGQDIEGAFILSGIFSLSRAIVEKRPLNSDTAIEVGKDTALGTGIGTTFGILQRNLLRMGLSPWKSWGLAGATIDVAIAGNANWNRITSFDLRLSAIGLGNTAIQGANGFVSSSVFYGVFSLGDGMMIIPAVAASGAVHTGLNYVEGKIGDFQLSENSRSLSQLSHDYEISYYFKKNNIQVRFGSPARKDLVTKAYQRGDMLNFLQLLLDNGSKLSDREIEEQLNSSDPKKRAEAQMAVQSRTFRALLAESGIKNIRADAPADLNIFILQTIVHKALDFKLRNGMSDEISVTIKAPKIYTFREGKIADYRISIISGNRIETFDCSLLLEGDPVAVTQRLTFEKAKDKFGLIDLLTSHASIPLNEIAQYPNLNSQIAKVLASQGYPMTGNIEDAVMQFLAKERAAVNAGNILDSSAHRLGRGDRSLDAADARIIISKLLSQDQLSQIMEKYNLLNMSVKEAEKINDQLESIKQQLSYINTAKGIGAIVYQPSSFDPDVLVIQSALYILGLLEKKEVNGCFGEATARALKEGGFNSSGRIIDKTTVQNIQDAFTYLKQAGSGDKRGWQEIRRQSKRARAIEPSMKASTRRGVVDTITDHMEPFRTIKRNRRVNNDQEQLYQSWIQQHPNDPLVGQLYEQYHVQEINLEPGLQLSYALKQTLMAMLAQSPDTPNKKISIRKGAEPHSVMIEIGSEEGVKIQKYIASTETSPYGGVMWWRKTGK